MIGYVPVAEECGALVDAGLMGKAEAIVRIAVASDGGLTLLGAENALDQWQTLRARIANIQMSVEMGIAACEAQLREQGGNER
ncbi:hypothetical protein FHR83_006650 [Actinoplanes campanulatus]|uniref:Uncharacterized protein n=1 Tax=Actinoplanes campanulatus TaxID=113559 RepID=A0A7W5AN88_9ACTN|nr:hypothetical protein [Actinoplanes campanulatus]MBB3098944.1 hypothetical protein [Actinoplanes campanulatus]GGN39741.1 hypothetical protein GCM10010109_68060 [Actinoplanes campanulatus]